jgi:hypothetical protein
MLAPLAVVVLAPLAVVVLAPLAVVVLAPAVLAALVLAAAAPVAVSDVTAVTTTASRPNIPLAARILTAPRASPGRPDHGNVPHAGVARNATRGSFRR